MTKEKWDEYGVYGIVAVGETGTERQGVYVGETTRPFKERWTEHASDLAKGKHTQKKLQRAYNRGSNLLFIPLHIASPEMPKYQQKPYVQQKEQAIWMHLNRELSAKGDYMINPEPLTSARNIKSYAESKGKKRGDLQKQISNIEHVQPEAPEMNFAEVQKDANEAMKTDGLRLLDEAKVISQNAGIREVTKYHGGITAGEWISGPLKLFIGGVVASPVIWILSLLLSVSSFGHSIGLNNMGFIYSMMGLMPAAAVVWALATAGRMKATSYLSQEKAIEHRDAYHLLTKDGVPNPLDTMANDLGGFALSTKWLQSPESNEIVILSD